MLATISSVDSFAIAPASFRRARTLREALKSSPKIAASGS